MTDLFEALIRTYAEAPIRAPRLKTITLAQWALESGWGSSELARDHRNFAGLKYRARVNAGRPADRPLATPVDYLAHDGEDTYCAFASLEDFIAGYWAFVGNGAMYDGWEAYAEDPSGYIAHLKRGGYAADPHYVQKVLRALPTLRREVMRLGLSQAFDEGTATPPETRRVAVLIGHNARSKGAYSPHLAVSEWDFNNRVCDHMKAMSGEYGLDVRKVLRQPGLGYSREIATAYAEIDALQPEAILELHFNAGGGRRSETLYLAGSQRGEILARRVQDAVTDLLGPTDRGPFRNGLLPRSEGRGITSLRASRHPTVLTEPFFGDTEADCDEMLAAGEDGLGRAYLIAARDALEDFSAARDVPVG